MKIYTFDSTLRDGAQGINISFSLNDKIKIIKILDGFGIDYIEAGNPFSNPKDTELFKELENIKLNHSKIVAFGSTKRKNINISEDHNIQLLSNMNTEIISIFGKCWDLHVNKILKSTLDENLQMIYDTIKFLSDSKKKVFFDAEHFFDGYKSNPKYAIQTLQTAEKAGAKYIILCDTNGGCFPNEIQKITEIAKESISIPIGIHCHNDTDCAIANSISAVLAGATQIQGTFIGIGERCGNANLSSLIPSLQIKLGYECVKNSSIETLTKTARHIAEIANVTLNDNTPYIGNSAFAHKGGMHVDAVNKISNSFEHISPSDVGNTRQFLLSEVSGRSTILSKLSKFAPNIDKDSSELIAIMEMLKLQEMKGYHYEAAEASFELLVLKFLGSFKEFFNIEYFKIIGEQSGTLQKTSTAMVKVRVNNTFEIAADEGDGPVNAIDKALKSALSKFFPEIINKIQLIDYKVRVMNTGSGTAAIVRVLIESTDGEDVWTTVGASYDIINASVKALVDSIEYKLYKSLKN